MRTPFLATTLLLLGTASPTALTTSAAAQDLPAPDPVTCEDWGSYDFFAWASADTVASCLRAGADPVAPLDESRGTPLHHAARATPDPAVIAVLVQAGADPNAPDLKGGTPLHEAAGSNSNPGIIAALLEAGADLDAPDSRGNTPLHSLGQPPRRVVLAAASDQPGSGPGTAAVGGRSSRAQRQRPGRRSDQLRALAHAGLRPGGRLRDLRLLPGVGRRYRCHGRQRQHCPPPLGLQPGPGHHQVAAGSRRRRPDAEWRRHHATPHRCAARESGGGGHPVGGGRGGERNE